MHLSQLDPQQVERFRSPQALFYDLHDGRTVLMLSGIVAIDLHAPGWSNEAADTVAYQLNLDLDLKLPDGFLAGSNHFIVEQSLPSVSLASVAGTANVLWGIQRFSILASQPLTETVQLRIEAEVARSAETLKAITYAVTLLGRRG
jgi:hypothetical protein